LGFLLILSIFCFDPLEHEGRFISGCLSISLFIFYSSMAYQSQCLSVRDFFSQNTHGADRIPEFSLVLSFLDPPFDSSFYVDERILSAVIFLGPILKCSLCAFWPFPRAGGESGLIPGNVFSVIFCWGRLFGIG